MSIETSVLIIGAGPYGVSLATELHRRGVACEIVGEPFSLWFNHTLSDVSLRSDFRVSQVYSHDGRYDLMTFLNEAYPASEIKTITSGRVPVPVFRDYLRWVLQRLPISIDNDRVVLLEKSNEGFLARTSRGKQILSKRVVLATGIENHRYIPKELQPLSARCVHSYDVAQYDGWENRSVLIVGGGQSAAEALVHLERYNRVYWLHRSPLIYFSEPINLPKPIFNLALELSPLFYHLPTRVHRWLAKRFVEATITPDLKPVLEGPAVRKLHGEIAALKLEARAEGIYSSHFDVTFDHILSCTGFHYSVDSLPFLSESLKETIQHQECCPLLDQSYQSTEPGLYIVGGMAEPIHGPAQRFMMGCRDATLKVSKALAR